MQLLKMHTFFGVSYVPSQSKTLAYATSPLALAFVGDNLEWFPSQAVCVYRHVMFVRVPWVAPIEERARLRARTRSCARAVLVEGGARMRAQARNADVPTKLNLPFPGVN